MTEPIPMQTLTFNWSRMMLFATATLLRNSVGENTLRKTRVDNSEPAHKIGFRGSSATNRLVITSAYGNELERSERRQIFRV